MGISRNWFARMAAATLFTLWVSVAQPAKPLATAQPAPVDSRQALMADVMQHQVDASVASLESMLCVGDYARAEQVVVAGLLDPSQRVMLLTKLQQPLLPIFDPVKLDKEIGELRRRPAVAAAFAKAGRDLPDQMRARDAE